MDHFCFVFAYTNYGSQIKLFELNIGRADNVKKLMYILEQVFKSAGITEYSAVDRGYSGDELLEKWKDNVQKSWKGKKEKESSIKKISKWNLNQI